MERVTAEDVLKKKFKAVKFREGYDQDDVDSFLDKVVVTITELQQENYELKQRLG